MIKKLISIHVTHDRKFRSLVSRMGGCCYLTNHKNNKKGYYCYEITFYTNQNFKELNDYKGLKYDFYYP